GSAGSDQIAARTQTATDPGQGQSGDLDLLLRRRQPGGYVRSQTRTVEAARRDDDWCGSGGRHHGNPRWVDAFAVEVQEVRAVRNGDLGVVSESRPACGRSCVDPFDERTQSGPR